MKKKTLQWLKTPLIIGRCKEYKDKYIPQVAHKVLQLGAFALFFSIESHKNALSFLELGLLNTHTSQQKD